ncbi:MAG: beta galactosidase jelly roll domain-containing protein [Desulfobacterales bacterium]|nr:beta galactosidase jelly roll domain-containing protein [Desulfobacterales bacterium]
MGTYRSNFSRQGQIGFRHGSIWYRAKVKLPALDDLKPDEGVGLFVGGGDHIVTAYVNGVKVGKISGFLKPGVWDITDHIARDGRPNSMVISVRRMTNNEVGTGGLMYPSFIFAGPRLAKPEESTTRAEYKIILPGVPQG